MINIFSSIPIKDLLETQKELIDEIFVLMYYGKFSYLDILLMPVDLRKQLLKKLIETKSQENEEMERIERETNINM